MRLGLAAQSGDRVVDFGWGRVSLLWGYGMSTVPAGHRIVYARPKCSAQSAWQRVAKCRHTAAHLEAMAEAGDRRVWRGIDGNLSVLAISPALEAR